MTGEESATWMRSSKSQGCYCRWISDSHDEYTKERLDAINYEYKLYRCHTILNCACACPKGLNPGKQIQHIKQLQAVTNARVPQFI